MMKKEELKYLIEVALKTIQTRWQIQKVEWNYKIDEHWTMSGTYEILIWGWVTDKGKILLIKYQYRWPEYPGMLLEGGNPREPQEKDKVEMERIETQAWGFILQNAILAAMEGYWRSTIEFMRSGKVLGVEKHSSTVYPLTPEECLEKPVPGGGLLKEIQEIKIGKETHALPTLKDIQDVIDQLSGVPGSMMGGIPTPPGIPADQTPNLS